MNLKIILILASLTLVLTPTAETEEVLPKPE